MIDDRPNVGRTRRAPRGVLWCVGILMLAVPTVAAAVTAVSRQAGQVRQLESELATLNLRYGQAAAAFSAANTRLNTVNNRITANTKALADAKAELATARANLALRLSASYRQHQPTALELVLRSGSLSEAFSRVELIKRVQQQDAESIKEIRAARARMEKVAVQLVADRASAKKEKGERETQLGQVTAIRGARLARLLTARSQLSVMIAAAQRAKDANRLATLQAAQNQVKHEIGGNRPNTPPPISQPPSVTPPTGGGGNVAAILQKIALCESGGNPRAVSPSGLYRGKYQFDPATWKAYGGSGDDPAAASEAEQDAVAARLYAARGSAPWPICGR